MVTINCPCGNSYIFRKNNLVCPNCQAVILPEIASLFENIDLCALELNTEINKRSNEGLCKKLTFTVC